MDNRTIRTDPRVIRTRQLLKDAFIELLQEMDIEKISVNRIAERATINRVTFYLHYKDIPDMMEKIADDMIEDIHRSLNMTSESQPMTEEDDWTMLVNLLEHFAENAKFYKVVLASRRTPIFTERLLNLLTELITLRIERMGGDAALTTNGVQKDIAIWYGSSALIGTIVAWLRKDMPYTPVFLAKQFTLMRSLS
ncbi:TetR-like C-terminal domain-containing protein [Paenibacillus qinlingensis]|uniref:AcrR family transcriptional regulator n=1 Tax=Paenibacillus qinlingensis TaxID=1837343 RepID=A0ABU1NSQ1_9BACL|nr:TetR-like C-terminal domain-containing protein [Paenibacillus qinlingensis]MDR6550469.1 AcrR family transcriptional regulator [Paenibacillus qinlingensis]